MLFNNLGVSTYWIKSEVSGLGVVFGSALSFQSHINQVAETSFFRCFPLKRLLRDII